MKSKKIINTKEKLNFKKDRKRKLERKKNKKDLRIYIANRKTRKTLRYRISKEREKEINKWSSCEFKGPAFQSSKTMLQKRIVK